MEEKDLGWINVVSKNSIWEFRVAKEFSKLFNKNGQPIVSVQELVERLERHDMNWDIAVYKNLVAFKNSCERTTTIYPKDYWDSRMRESFKRLDWIEFS